MWPGRVRSDGVEDAEASTRAVNALSAALIPVLTPTAASQETV